MTLQEIYESTQWINMRCLSVLTITSSIVGLLAWSVSNIRNIRSLALSRNRYQPIHFIHMSDHLTISRYAIPNCIMKAHSSCSYPVLQSPPTFRAVDVIYYSKKMSAASSCIRVKPTYHWRACYVLGKRRAWHLNSIHQRTCCNLICGHQMYPMHTIALVHLFFKQQC